MKYKCYECAELVGVIYSSNEHGDKYVCEDCISREWKRELDVMSRESRKYHDNLLKRNIDITPEIFQP